ncbi:uncharacterized [Tachysurus ichikawai]
MLNTITSLTLIVITRNKQCIVQSWSLKSVGFKERGTERHHSVFAFPHPTALSAVTQAFSPGENPHSPSDSSSSSSAIRARMSSGSGTASRSAIRSPPRI